VAAPEPKETSPLLPPLALPELNTSMPLTPDTPALKLRIETMPLLLAVPSPLPMLTAPPVLIVLRPENI